MTTAPAPGPAPAPATDASKAAILLGDAADEIKAAQDLLSEFRGKPTTTSGPGLSAAEALLAEQEQAVLELTKTLDKQINQLKAENEVSSIISKSINANESVNAPSHATTQPGPQEKAASSSMEQRAAAATEALKKITRDEKTNRDLKDPD